MAAEFRLLKASLKPLKLVVLRKGGALCASVAMKTVVAPTTPMAGQMCSAWTRETGKSQMDFWSASMLVGSAFKETLRSSEADDAEEVVAAFCA